MSECRDCGHYEIYKMINSGKSYGYAGDIPCLRCSRYKMFNDEFVGVKPSGNMELVEENNEPKQNA